MEKPKQPYSKENLEEAKEAIQRDPGGGGIEGYAQWLHIPADTFRDFEGMRVLDLGAGKNLNFARSLEEAGIKANVVSFSPAFADKEMRQEMEGRKESDNIVAGMGESLPFADGTFDRVMCVSVFEFVDSYERYIMILKEVARVLAPGGIAYLGPIGPEMPGEPGAYIEKEELEEILEHQVSAEWDIHAGQASDFLQMYTLKLEKQPS